KTEWKFSGRWDYATSKIGDDPNQIEQDRYRTALQMRYNLTNRLFGQSRTIYLKDLVRSVDHDLEQSLGIGWRLLESERLKISITPSATFRYLDIEGLNKGWESRLTIYQDLQWVLLPRVVFREEASVSFEPHNS